MCIYYRAACNFSGWLWFAKVAPNVQGQCRLQAVCCWRQGAQLEGARLTAGFMFKVEFQRAHRRLQGCKAARRQAADVSQTEQVLQVAQIEPA